MSRVRSRGNLSTEFAVERLLVGNAIVGWVKQPKGIFGNPDFYFERNRLLLFVDGCFWHGCAKCNRRIPVTRSEFWEAKITRNRRRDQRQRRKLRSLGFHVMRIWEHEASSGRWLGRLRAMLKRYPPAEHE